MCTEYAQVRRGRSFAQWRQSLERRRLVSPMSARLGTMQGVLDHQRARRHGSTRIKGEVFSLEQAPFWSDGMFRTDRRFYSSRPVESKHTRYARTNMFALRLKMEMEIAIGQSRGLSAESSINVCGMLRLCEKENKE